MILFKDILVGENGVDRGRGQIEYRFTFFYENLWKMKGKVENHRKRGGAIYGNHFPIFCPQFLFSYFFFVFFSYFS